LFEESHVKKVEEKTPIFAAEIAGGKNWHIGGSHSRI